ncbi:methyltransferase domain-containing protein [Candidatus Nomurabacteria bacterium]|nr:methyltransferase domain-containing protein [Candidatus Nomurabacteria bacterium]
MTPIIDHQAELPHDILPRLYMIPVIRTKSQSSCPICKESGNLAYESLQDTFLSAPGGWNMRSCNNNECSTYWLDPQPLPEDIGKLYANYPTHTNPPRIQERPSSFLRKLLETIRSSVLAHHYGYPSNIHKALRPVLSTVAWLHPGWRDAQFLQVYYIPFIPNGHLLDIGCGGGSAMIDMQNRGWRTTGTDFDTHAVENARQKNLTVFQGDLLEQQFPDNTFDAILMSHVIEHVPDPIAHLRECYRVLKPGGYLVAFTPNARSSGHIRFRKHWRGLEIPRHLQVFTPESLEYSARNAGFKTAFGRTTLQGVFYLWDASKAMEECGTFDIPPYTRFKRLQVQFSWLLSGIRYTFAPGREETALLWCQKQKTSPLS